jgi:hypothetical protein
MELFKVVEVERNQEICGSLWREKVLQQIAIVGRCIRLLIDIELLFL